MEESGILRYIIILLLILVNGFFSGTEMAIVSVNKNKLKILVDQNDNRAILLQKILEDPSKLLSTIQIAVTISGFLASAFSAVGISEGLEVYLLQLGIPYSKKVSVIIVTVILSYLTLVFGELVPKRIGIRYSDSIALNTIKFVNMLCKLLRPFILIVSFSTNFVLKIFNFDMENIKDEITKEEIKTILEGDNITNEIEASEINIIKKVIDFDEKSAREIMKPRTSIFAIDVDEKLINVINEPEFIKYSRIPVYREDLDNIVGILYVKEVLQIAYKKGFENIDIKDIIKEAYFVPESININNLFKSMKNENKHMTILVDEYGGVSGMVTLEDLLEEIVGNISDEFDSDDDKRIIKLNKNKYLVECEISLNDLNEALSINLKSEYYDSLNGFLIEKLGYIPVDDEKIPNLEIDNILFQFYKIQNKKIEKVILEIKDLSSE